MSDGFCFWYTGLYGRDGVERFLHVFETHGVHLAHPVSQVVSVVTDGPDSWGEPLPVERTELVELLTLTDRTEVNFQLWLNDETDMFTRIHRLADDRLVVEFGLDGMSGTEQETAVRAVSRAVDEDWDNTWGVVIDRRGLTEETDWDGVILGRPAEITGWPDVLGVHPEAAARHPRLRGAQGASKPPLVVFGDGASG